MGRKSKGKSRQERHEDIDEEFSVDGTLMSEDNFDEESAETVRDHLNDFLEALQDKKVKNKDFFVDQTLRLLQKNYIAEDATTYIADVVSQQTKKQCLERIVKIVALLFLQDPDESYLSYLQQIDTAASMRAQLLIKFILDDAPTPDDIQKLFQKLKQSSDGQIIHVLEAFGLILADGGVLLLSTPQQDRLADILGELVQAQSSAVRHLAAKLSACMNEVDDLPQQEFVALGSQSLSSSMTQLSIETAMEQNIRPTERSVKKVHKKERALDKAQSQYLNMMRGQGYQSKTVTMQFGNLSCSYQIDSLQTQIVDETMRWILEAGINTHVFQNPVVQAVLHVQTEKVGAKLSATTRQQQKKDRKKVMGYNRIAKGDVIDYY